MTDVKIVEFSETYREALVTLFDEFQRELVAMDPDKRLVWQEGFGKWYLEANLEDVNKGGKLFLAVLNQEIVGFLIGEVKKPKPSEFGPPAEVSGTISELFVKKEFRNKGVASKLMASVEEFFEASEVRYVWVSVLAFNKPPQELYRKFGYHDRGIDMFKRLDKLNKKPEV